MKNRNIPLFLVFCLVPVILSLTGCGAVFTGSDTASAVLISEAVSSNSLSLYDPYTGTPDWIEFYNTSSDRVDLSGCGLTDNLRDPHKWTFPEETSIEPGGYLLVYCAKDPGGLPKNVLCTGFGLSKSGEFLFFTDRYYNVLQQIELPQLDKDISWARNEDGVFGYCAFPTPGEANSKPIVDDAKELQYQGAEGALVISEAMPNNAGFLVSANGGSCGWAEIQNVSPFPVDLHDYWLSDNSADLSKWRLPEATLESGDFMVIYLSGLDSADGEIHASFRLGPEDCALYLCDKQAKVISEIRWDVPLPENVSAVRTENGSVYTAFPTPGAENSGVVFENSDYADMDESDPVRISEVLKSNQYSIMDQDGDRPEWIEIHNASGSPVDLSCYYLSDDPADRVKWAFPDVYIEGGEYMVIFLSDKDRKTGELHASFGLGEYDSSVFLTCLNGLRSDRIDVADVPDNVSVGRDDKGAVRYYAEPTPGAPNDSAAFESLELVRLIDPEGVYISEVSASQKAKSNDSDWIELFNGGSGAVDLAGWHISDDLADPGKFEIDGVKIPAKGYVLIHADPNSSESKGVTAPFGISESGEKLLLTNSEGFAVDMFETGAQRAGLSSGRMPGDAGGERFFFEKPTPNAENVGGIKSYTASPVFSSESLYNKEHFELRITCATPGARIYYTLDGSLPSENSNLYTSPIPIEGNTPVRAAAVCEGYLDSEITTHTFLFEEKHSLPVVCISGDPDSIREVYSVTDRWQKVEREGYTEYFEADGKLGISFPCGLRVSGASTLLAAQKSLSIYLRSGYGRNSVTYPFFKDSDVNTFRSLVIRSGGQDRTVARIRDSFFSRAVKGMNIDFAETRPCVVYINGKYWGIYDLNENQNENYLESHYGADPNEVDIIRRNTTHLEGDNRDIKRVREYALSRDLSDGETYAKFCEWVDSEAFIDYIAAQVYFANSDMFNQKYWRSWDYSVKWRPIFFDLDFGLSGNSPSRNIISSYFQVEGVPSQDGSLTNMDIFCGLKKNKGWREKFAERYVWLIVNQFDPERLTGILKEMAGALEPEMQRHIKRWGAPRSVASWKNEIEGLQRALEKRPQYALKQLQDYFGVSDEQMRVYIEKAEKEKP